MDYTPRQVMAFLDIVEHRKRQERSELLGLHHLAAQGDGKAIREQLKKWDS
jgi:hypothetical protein